LPVGEKADVADTPHSCQLFKIATRERPHPLKGHEYDYVVAMQDVLPSVYLVSTLGHVVLWPIAAIGARLAAIVSRY
jgi:hypothetical protein